MGTCEGFLLSEPDKLLTRAMNGRAVQVLTGCHGWVGTNSYNPKNLSWTCLFFYSKHDNTGPLQFFQPSSGFQPDASFFFPQCRHQHRLPPLGTSQSFHVVQSGPQVWSPDQQHRALQYKYHRLPKSEGLYFNKLSRRCLGMLTFENYCCQGKHWNPTPLPEFKFQLLKNIY